MEDQFGQFTLYVSALIELGAAVIIGAAVGSATLRLAYAFIKRSLSHTVIEIVRLRLGRWLVLGLEYLVAADVLRTAVAPSWTEIGQLAAIIAIRTVLNYFLEKDIERASEEQDVSD